jgi:membrane-associated phospholipid phosphatase
MSRSWPTEQPARNSARPLPALVVGATAFAALMMAVRLEWAPLRTLDRGVSSSLNELVGPSGPAAATLRIISDLGDPLVTAAVLLVLTGVLLIRRLPRLAAWVAVTGVGLAVLDPLVKDIVGRDRPALPIVVATAPGESFPSGHALASFATFTILLLVALPTIPAARRWWAYAATVVVIGAVGFTRIALGVHYLTDVLAGWGLSAAWVASTALVLRVRQVQQGEETSRLRDGIAPEAAAALRPAPLEDRPLGGRPWRTAAQLAAVLAALTTLISGLGLLLTGVLQGTWVGRFDRAASAALTTLGAPALDAPAAAVNAIGGTPFVMAVALVSVVISVAALRRYRPAVFLIVSLLGEVTVYLVVSRLVVSRARPGGSQASNLPDLASYPSGHAAAAMTLYGVIALIVHVHVRGRWRAVALVAPVIVGTLVAFGRLYRGVHYPTDVLASALLSVLWLAATYRLVLRPDRVPRKPDSEAG